MMANKIIIEKLERCIEKLKKEDWYLIENNASERSIAHRLAVYLEGEFREYNIDCEYNINIEHQSGRKKIYLLKEEVEKYKSKNQKIEDKEVSIFPDIIVHKRGVNTNNILVIEMKKDTSTIEDNFDRFKLEKFTATEDGDNLFYKLGCALKILTTSKNVSFELYEEGKLIKLEKKVWNENKK